MTRVMIKPVFEVSDQVQQKSGPIQSQKIARGLKFRIYEEEELYYKCSKNKGADQLHGFEVSDQVQQKSGPIQSQKIARGLKFRIYEEEELYYKCSKNKGADQLHGYHTADLRLSCHICKKQVFS